MISNQATTKFKLADSFLRLGDYKVKPLATGKPLPANDMNLTPRQSSSTRTARGKTLSTFLTSPKVTKLVENRRSPLSRELKSLRSSSMPSMAKITRNPLSTARLSGIHYATPANLQTGATASTARLFYSDNAKCHATTGVYHRNGAQETARVLYTDNSAACHTPETHSKPKAHFLRYLDFLQASSSNRTLEGFRERLKNLSVGRPGDTQVRFIKSKRVPHLLSFSKLSGARDTKQESIGDAAVDKMNNQVSLFGRNLALNNRNRRSNLFDPEPPNMAIMTQIGAPSALSSKGAAQSSLCKTFSSKLNSASKTRTSANLKLISSKASPSALHKDPLDAITDTSSIIEKSILEANIGHRPSAKKNKATSEVASPISKVVSVRLSEKLAILDICQTTIMKSRSH